MLLAIETSCDESAVALFDYEQFSYDRCTLLESLVCHEISSQIELHREYGGVVPELAAREHLKNLPLVLTKVFNKASEKLKKTVGIKDIKYIAVTQGPGLKGCLLVGISFSKGLALRNSLPLIPINHLEGHVLSSLLSSSYKNLEEIFPAICLLVSGGHTQLLYVPKIGEYELISDTMDDAAGEAFDKVGTILGLPYPAGATVSKLAKNALLKDLRLPIGVPNELSHFSFSGLKTAAARLIKEEKEKIIKNPQMKFEERIPEISYALEQAVIKALSKKLLKAISLIKDERKKELKSIFLSGGVAANVPLRALIQDISEKNSLNFLVPDMEFCTDNAAMIGASCALHLKNKIIPTSDINSYSFSALPRFPLYEL